MTAHHITPGSNLPLVGSSLAAPEPGWFENTDVVIVGSGIAGLALALHLREAGLHVTVVTKVNTDDGSTKWAQGGIAAVLDPLDSLEAHARDTLVAGVGLCDSGAVDLLVREGPSRIRELMRWGADFDRRTDGSLMLTREGGHHARRIVHAGGDATGAEVQRTLHEAVRRDPWIRLFEHSMVLDLLRDTEGRACGLTLHVLGEGTDDGVGAILARAVVLASGGMGQIFTTTTNPVVSTGDGVALALRAGADITDIEFVQFHPTALLVPRGNSPEADTARQPLVSEALRGEGAYLRDSDGKRFMVGLHDLAELAPRDIVAKASYQVMMAEGSPRSGSTPGIWERRFSRRDFRRLSPPAAPWASIPLRISFPSPQQLTTPPEEFGPTTAVGQRYRASTPAARLPVPVSTAPIDWRPTLCWKDWCSHAGSRRTSRIPCLIKVRIPSFQQRPGIGRWTLPPVVRCNRP